jgi:imidazolonepropionase-like amidohydrolase
MVMTRREFLATLGALALPVATRSMTAMAAGPPGAFAPCYALIGPVCTGHGSLPRPDTAVLVDHGRIEAVIPATDPAMTAIRANRPVLALTETTILPGIINAHVHSVHTPAERRKRYLLHGVTAMGDAASPLAALPHLLDSPAGETTTTACAGPLLCPPGGYPLPVHSPDHALVAASPSQAREEVRRLADAGATCVKLAFEPGPYVRPWPLFDPATARALCDEARRLGLTIRCHVEDLGGLEPALQAGVDTIEHVPHRHIGPDGPAPVLTKGGDPVPHYRRQLEIMARDGVIMTPTLDVLSRSIWKGEALFVPVRAFADLGGGIALGNDHPYRRTGAGMPLREMELLVRAGLNVPEIIRAATQNAALACGFGDRGVLAPGQAADMVVVQGDVMDGVGVLAKPMMVIKDGVVVV